MGKKPTSAPPPAPSGLSDKSRRLWAEAMEIQRRWNGPRLEVLHQALCALDRSDQARAAVDAAGLTTTTESTGAVHLHPALRIEREARAQALKAFELLGLLSLGGGGFMTSKEFFGELDS